MDRRGLGSRLGGDLVVLEGGLHLPGEAGQVAEVLEEERVGRRPRRLAEAEPGALGVAAGVVDEGERVEERGVLDPSLLGPRFDVLQELAGLLGERLRVVAGELLEPLREAVGGEPLAEPLEALAGLAAEEEALRRLLPLRLVGQGVPLRGGGLQLFLGRGEAGLEVGGLLPERVRAPPSRTPARGRAAPSPPRGGRRSSFRRAISSADEALRADRERKRTTAAIAATAATARATSSPVDKGAPPRERNGATGDFTSGRGRAGMRSRRSGPSPRRSSDRGGDRPPPRGSSRRSGEARSAGRSPLECRVPRNRMKSSRPALVALGGLLLAVVVPAPGAGGQGARRRPRVRRRRPPPRLAVPRRGEAPEPRRSSRSEGSFSPLRPTIPAQTPVSWSTFSTGLSPGRTQIFDFLKRDPKTYRPEFAIATEGKKDFLLGRGNRAGRRGGRGAPRLPPRLRPRPAHAEEDRCRPPSSPSSSRRRPASSPGASAASSPSRSRPSTTTGRGRRSGRWPARRGSGRSSSTSRSPFRPSTTTRGASSPASASPTCRGRIGTPSYYTSDPFFAPKNKNEFSVELVRLESNVGTIRTEVFGPYNKLFGEPPVIKIADDAHGPPRRRAPEDRAEGERARDAEAGRVVALGHLHVRVQPRREALGHRALPPRGHRAGDPALPLARSTSTRRSSLRASRSPPRAASRRTSRSGSASTRRWAGRSTPGR